MSDVDFDKERAPTLECRPPGPAEPQQSFVQSVVGNSLACRMAGAAARHPRVDEANAAIDEVARSAAPPPSAASKEWKRLTPAEIEANARYRERPAGDRVHVARVLIDRLTAADFGGTEADLRRIRGELYQRLNTVTPYFTQMVNENVLPRGAGENHQAWARTCNVTSIAMALEALGARVADFQGDLTMMDKILDILHAPARLSLRMPDFLQYVAIYVSLKKKSPAPVFDPAELAAAQSDAADRITRGGEFDNYTRLFGVKATYVTHSMETALTEKGELYKRNRKITSARVALAGTVANSAKLDQEIHELEQQIAGAPEQQKAKLRRQLTARRARSGKLTKTQAAQQTGLNRAEAAKAQEITALVNDELKGTQAHVDRLEKRLDLQVKERARTRQPSRQAHLDEQIVEVRHQLADAQGRLAEQKSAQPERIQNFEEHLEAELPSVDAYRDALLPGLDAALAAGRQIIGNRVSHFVRVESVNDRGIVVDDPAENGKDFLITWADAREQGFFRHYLFLDR